MVLHRVQPIIIRKLFFINSKCFVVVVFFASEFSLFYPSLSKGFTYTYCVLPHTAILNNFSLIFVIVSLVFSEACLCFTFNLFIVYLNFLSFLCILNNFVATLASPEKLSKKIINRKKLGLSELCYIMLLRKYWSCS